MRRILSLFRSSSNAGAAAPYAAIVAEARRPHWYVEGEVDDTIDGRFALLSTLVALAILRLEQGGEEAVRGAVLLTEEYIDDMDAQMRQAGFGDPTLGKEVRKMVSAMAARTERFRQTVENGEDWTDTVRRSVYRDRDVSEQAITFTSEMLRRFHEQLGGASDSTLMEGALA